MAPAPIISLASLEGGDSQSATRGLSAVAADHKSILGSDKGRKSGYLRCNLPRELFFLIFAGSKPAVVSAASHEPKNTFPLLRSE